VAEAERQLVVAEENGDEEGAKDVGGEVFVSRIRVEVDGNVGLDIVEEGVDAVAGVAVGATFVPEAAVAVDAGISKPQYRRDLPDKRDFGPTYPTEASH